ncbi:hypothetical protein D3C73_979610 [compost metagenome]
MRMSDAVPGLFRDRIHPGLRHMRHDLVDGSAHLADDMLVLIHPGIVTACRFAQLQLADQLLVSQIAEGVVHGSISKVMSLLDETVHHIGGGWMVMGITDNIIDSLTL